MSLKEDINTSFQKRKNHSIEPPVRYNFIAKRKLNSSPLNESKGGYKQSIPKEEKSLHNLRNPF